MTVSFRGRDQDDVRLADLHAGDSLIEAGNHLSGADREAQRRAAVVDESSKT